ncbi:hypothetical protein JHK86_018313 [Glycine max]|nr:hypothetical protein JHK86_018313 [Glycine max]
MTILRRFGPPLQWNVVGLDKDIGDKYVSLPWYKFLQEGDFNHGDELSFYYRRVEKIWELIGMIPPSKEVSSRVEVRFGSPLRFAGSAFSFVSCPSGYSYYCYGCFFYSSNSSFCVCLEGFTVITTSVASASPVMAPPSTIVAPLLSASVTTTSAPEISPPSSALPVSASTMLASIAFFLFSSKCLLRSHLHFL